MLIDQTKFDARLFYEAERPAFGFTELPRDVVVWRGDYILIVGRPGNDVLQFAFSTIGFPKKSPILKRYPEGERITGILVNLAA